MCSDKPHGRNLRTGRVDEPGYPYHITKCLARSCSCSLATNDLALVVINSIRWHQQHGLAHLLAFVVMPDHVHWLFVLGRLAAGHKPEGVERFPYQCRPRSLSGIVREFSKYTSLQINRTLGRSRPLWQHGFHDHLIKTDREEALVVLEYVHGNPVRKGLCEEPEDWPWSTANPKYARWIEEARLW